MIVVIKNAIKSQKLGYMTALGVGLAIFVHVAYCIAGVGIIISQSVLLFSIIKILGALYLLYIAYQLFSSGKSETHNISAASTDQTLFSAFREGFITNVMNPKATLFFLSVFTQVISPETALVTQGLYGTMMAGVVGICFMILTTIINIAYIRSHIASVQYYLNKIMGGLLVFLGLKILFSAK